MYAFFLAMISIVAILLPPCHAEGKFGPNVGADLHDQESYTQYLIQILQDHWHLKKQLPGIRLCLKVDPAGKIVNVSSMNRDDLRAEVRSLTKSLSKLKLRPLPQKYIIPQNFYVDSLLVQRADYEGRKEYDKLLAKVTDKCWDRVPHPGFVIVVLWLNKDGRLLDASITRHSSDQHLDNEILECLRSTKYPPLPSSCPVDNDFYWVGSHLRLYRGSLE